MNRNLARVGIGLAWIVSLALAYVVGKQSAGSRKAEVSSVTDGAKAVTIPSQGGGGSAGATSEKTGGAKGGDPAAGVESRDVRALVAEARRQIGSGSGFFLNPSTVMRALGPLMELSPEELKVAIEEISGAVTDPQQKMMFLSVLLGKWAEDDPKAALEYAEKLQEDAGPTATQALFPVIGSWAREDPEAVWKWFLKKRDSDDFSNGIM
ncbi:MAG: hypothetical protein KDM64_19620, partial [Verrucomicrobiae bacterium]|nr:hypothetical protein [Verrucomicrobiae bacterium]